MPNAKISALTAATTPLAGTEVVPLVQSSTTKKVAVSDLTAGRDVSCKSLAVVDAAGIVNIFGSTSTSFRGVNFRYTTADSNVYGSVAMNIDPGEVRYSAGFAGWGGYHSFYANGVNQLLVTSAEVKVMVNNITIGTAAKGVNFTANTGAAGKTSNLLNWYEEGTWTPALTAGTSGTITTGSAGGTYTRIGRQVTATGYIDVASVSAPVGALSITGLPFACGAGLGSRSAASIYPSALSATATTSVVGRIISGETKIRVDKFAAGTINNLAGDVVAASSFHFSVTYFV